MKRDQIDTSPETSSPESDENFMYGEHGLHKTLQDLCGGMGRREIQVSPRTQPQQARNPIPSRPAAIKTVDPTKALAPGGLGRIVPQPK